MSARGRWPRLACGKHPQTPCFWQLPEADAFVDVALFSKVQMVDRFSKDTVKQVGKGRKPHAQQKHVEGYRHRFCQESSYPVAQKA